MSGRTCHAALLNAPGRLAPTSRTVTRWRYLVRRIAQASPILELLAPRVELTGNDEDRMGTAIRVVVVLPRLPVMATKVLRNIRRRHTNASALNARPASVRKNRSTRPLMTVAPAPASARQPRRSML